MIINELNNKKEISLLFFFIFTIISCRFVGLTHDYNILNDKQKEIIQSFDSSTNLKNGYIYEINATQLKRLIREYDRAMVYVFTNGCSSKYCKPLNYYVNYAKENNYKLFLVMTGYTHLKQTLEQEINLPFFSINHKYYGTNIRKYYTQYFENELLDKQINDHSDYQGDIYIFQKGKLIEILKDFKEKPYNQ